MEMWDCYTWDRQKLDHQHPRGVPLAQGEYHLVVEIWTVNRRGEILLTQRHPDKPYGCLWEMSGGSVLAGETSREGASRELREEVGLMCPPEDLVYIGTVVRGWSIVALYRFDHDFDVAALTLQPEEVVAARSVTREEFLTLASQKQIVPHVSLEFQLYEKKILSGNSQ